MGAHTGRVPWGTDGCAHTLTQVAKSIGDITSLFSLGISYYCANWLGTVQAQRTLQVVPKATSSIP